MSIIKISHLSKSFDNNVILDDVSLSIEKGDIYGILGLSGAGKSTLIRCINGLETYDNGEILLNDEVLSTCKEPMKRNKKKKIAMIFQQFNLLQQLTVLQNVEFALEINKMYDKKTRKDKALAVLKRVGLEDKLNSYPSQLSGGQKQRVAIARALVLEPEILLSDEATSALDPETTASILTLLKELNKELGLTIIMISHQIEVIEQICNKVAIIANTKIVEQGSLSEVFLNPKTEVAKRIIYSKKIQPLLDESRMLRILFDGNLDEPIIANIIISCNIMVSIAYADTKVIDGKLFGQVLIKVPSNNADFDKLKQYLMFQNINYEEVL